MDRGLPKKVLAEYVGQYELHYKDTFLQDAINQFGGPYEKVIVMVNTEDNRLYLTLPFAPKTEVFWKSKDLFDAVSFYSTELSFLRDNSGKVDRLNIKWDFGETTVARRV